jgi:hypothetical protein
MRCVSDAVRAVWRAGQRRGTWGIGEVTVLCVSANRSSATRRISRFSGGRVRHRVGDTSPVHLGQAFLLLGYKNTRKGSI